MGWLSGFFEVLGDVFFTRAPPATSPSPTDATGPADPVDEADPEFIGLGALFPARSRVLDLGCGDGRNLRAMEAAGLRVVGADKRREGLARARDRTKAPLVLANLRALPFAAGRFDGVVAWQVLCGLPPESTRVGFEEARRILHADGSLLVAGCEGGLVACGLDRGAPGPAGFDTLARERLAGSFWSSEARWVYQLRPRAAGGCARAYEENSRESQSEQKSPVIR